MIKLSCVIDVRVHIWCISVTGLSEPWWQHVLTYQTKQGVSKRRNIKLCAISQLYYSAKLCVRSICSIHLYFCTWPSLKYSVSLQPLHKEKSFDLVSKVSKWTHLSNKLNCILKRQNSLVQVISLSPAILILSSCHRFVLFCYSNTLLQLKIHIHLKKAVTCLPKETYTA